MRSQWLTSELKTPGCPRLKMMPMSPRAGLAVRRDESPVWAAMSALVPHRYRCRSPLRRTPPNHDRIPAPHDPPLPYTSYTPPVKTSVINSEVSPINSEVSPAIGVLQRAVLIHEVCAATVAKANLLRFLCTNLVRSEDQIMQRHNYSAKKKSRAVCERTTTARPRVCGTG